MTNCPISSAKHRERWLLHALTETDGMGCAEQREGTEEEEEEGGALLTKGLHAAILK